MFIISPNNNPNNNENMYKTLSFNTVETKQKVV